MYSSTFTLIVSYSNILFFLGNETKLRCVYCLLKYFQSAVAQFSSLFLKQRGTSILHARNT